MPWLLTGLVSCHGYSLAWSHGQVVSGLMARWCLVSWPVVSGLMASGVWSHGQCGRSVWLLTRSGTCSQNPAWWTASECQLAMLLHDRSTGWVVPGMGTGYLVGGGTWYWVPGMVGTWSGYWLRPYSHRLKPSKLAIPGLKLAISWPWPGPGLVQGHVMAR